MIKKLTQLTGFTSFNLLLLSENEKYILEKGLFKVNFSVHLKETDDSNSKKIKLPSLLPESIEVNIHLCSKSIWFQPNDRFSNLIKLSFDSIENVNLVEIQEEVNSSHCSSNTTRTIPYIEVITSKLICIPVKFIDGHMRVIMPFNMIEPEEFNIWKVIIEPKHLHTIDNTPFVSVKQLLEDPSKLENLSPELFLKLSHALMTSYQVYYKSRQPINKTKNSYTKAIKALITNIPHPNFFSILRYFENNEVIVVSPILAEFQQPFHTVRCIVACTNKAFYFKLHPSTSQVHIMKRDWSMLQHARPTIVDLYEFAFNLIFTNDEESSLDKFQSEDLILILSTKETYNDILGCIEKFRPKALVSFKDRAYIEHVTELWRDHHIDNYHYLEFCNFISGRSCVDFSQYPVMPWTLTDFNSMTLDLSSPNSYRDLSLPIGMLISNRNKSSENKIHFQSSHNDEHNNFFEEVNEYHYSTSSSIVHWLLRQYPEYELKLKSGRFDIWQRIFHSTRTSWSYLDKKGASSYMELIPEFYNYTSTSFLENTLGIKILDNSNISTNYVCIRLYLFLLESYDVTSLKVLSDVELPLWADGKTFNFLKLMREALESPYVSDNLHHWIDLIFGYKQQGAHAKDSHNCYSPVTYLTCHTALKNDDLKNNILNCLWTSGCNHEGLITQVRDFGQIPIQIFIEAHPSRKPFDSESLKKYQESSSHMNDMLSRERSCLPWYAVLMAYPYTPSSELNKITSKLTTESSTNESVPDSISSKAFEASYNETNMSVLGGCHTQVLSKFRQSFIQRITIHNNSKITCMDSFPTDTSYSIFAGTDDGYLCQAQFDQDNNNNNVVSRPERYLPVSEYPLSKVVHIESKSATIIGNTNGDLYIASDSDSYSSPFNFMALNKIPPSDHNDEIVDICYDQDTICSVSKDYEVCVWSMREASLELISNDHCEGSTIDLKNNILLTGSSNDGTIMLWDIRDLRYGPYWVGQITNGKVSSRYKMSIVQCGFNNNDTTTFSAVSFMKKQKYSKKKEFVCLYPFYDSREHYIPLFWESRIWDLRKLPPQSSVLSVNIDNFFFSRFQWPDDIVINTGMCDGLQWSIVMGACCQKIPPSLENINLNNEKDLFPNLTGESTSFASIADMSKGDHTEEMRRWALQLHNPYFLLDKKFWRFNQTSTNISFWVANEIGDIEFFI